MYKNEHELKEKAPAFYLFPYQRIERKYSPSLSLLPIHTSRIRRSESLKNAPTVPHSENVVLLPAFKKRCHQLSDDESFTRQLSHEPHQPSCILTLYIMELKAIPTLTLTTFQDTVADLQWSKIRLEKGDEE